MKIPNKYSSIGKIKVQEHKCLQMIQNQNINPPSYPLSAAKLHQSHLHQQHLLPCTAYTIIAKHTQIGWA